MIRSLAAAVFATLSLSPALAADILPVPLNPVVPEANRTCTAKTASGLGYAQLRKAEGKMPGATDVTLLAYIGYLAKDGQTFDQNARAALPVDGVIPGFSEGLKMMAVGSVYRFCIPAAMGYGDRDSGPIPANSDLVFQVELLDMRTRAELDAMRKAQPAK